MPSTPKSLVLTPEQRRYLDRVAHTLTAAYRDVLQAKIVLYADAGYSHTDIAHRLDCDAHFVSTTQARFMTHGLAGLYNHLDLKIQDSGSGDQITFGVSPVGLYPFGVPPAAVLFEFASAAERLGFASLWLGDHLMFHVPVLESLTFLAAIAARTERLKVGTSVYLMPLRHPTLVAKVTSTLDVLSGGRLIFGIGIGGENPREFEASAAEVRSRASRTDEGLEVLKRLWTESNVTHHGRHYRLDDVTLDPKPLQNPHPPIWVGARSDAGLQRAVRVGDGWVSVMITPNRFKRCRQRIEELARQQGRLLDEFVFAHYAFLYVTDDLATGRSLATEFLSRLYNQSFDALVDHIGIVGPAEACVERLQQFVDAGVNYLILAPACGPQEQVEQLEVYAQHIVPRLRAPQLNTSVHTPR
jgi:probable F420-dependent oxidoreductase